MKGNFKANNFYWMDELKGHHPHWGRYVLYQALFFQDDQTDRQEVLHKWCTENGFPTRQPTIETLQWYKYDFSEIYVNEEHKVIYCHIPKTGCTNWKRYFILLSGVLNYNATCENILIHSHTMYNRYRHHWLDLPLECIALWDTIEIALHMSSAFSNFLTSNN